MGNKTKPKFYVVWKGVRPGVYASWDETSRQVSGFAGAKYKSFESRAEADAAFRGAAVDYIGKRAAPNTKPALDLARMGVDLNGIAVDAACSGVPGPMEYRGVELRDRTELFRAGPYEDGTNNIGEFLAIVHALALLKKQGRSDIPIYSDSRNAIGWIRAKQCRTKLIPTEQNKPIFDLIFRALKWLRENEPENPIRKWETEDWGENPADFGRK
jgi:ribonuclease HI